MNAINLFWTANKAFLAHCVITVAAIGLSLLDGSALLAIPLLALWILTGGIWLEWKNSF